MSGITKEELTYEVGKLYLGHTQGYEAGIETERHAITIAGSRSGKGACVIIPNLLRWPHNVLVVDPKGENAEKTWEARQKLGLKIYVVDPFETADVPAHLRASFNPLEGIDPDSLTGSSDLKVIADGLVKRSDPRHAQWDDGAVTVLAGIMAYVLTVGADDAKTLKSVRDILLLDRDELYAEAQDMKTCETFDGIAQDAGSIIMTGIEQKESLEGQIIGNAKTHIQWINLQAMRNVLEESTFSLSELKNGKASVYLVLPPEYLDAHGAFLRLFVRCAINAMAKGGSGKGEKCLFILDEFKSLGKIEAIATASGLMPSYGVQLWPFLQDLGQLVELYGKEGGETFFANADVHQFFGNTDQLTLEQISVRMGAKSSAEIPLPPPPPASTPSMFGQGVSSLAMGSKLGSARVMGSLAGGAITAMTNKAHAEGQADYQHRMNLYNRLMAEHGKPRMSPEEVAMKVRKKDDVVADGMICFVFGSEPIFLSLAPYFRKLEPVQSEADTNENSGIGNHEILAAAILLTSAIVGGWLGSVVSGSTHWMAYAGGAVALVTVMLILDQMGVFDFLEPKD